MVTSNWFEMSAINHIYIYIYGSPINCGHYRYGENIFPKPRTLPPYPISAHCPISQQTFINSNIKRLSNFYLNQHMENKFISFCFRENTGVFGCPGYRGKNASLDRNRRMWSIF